MKVVGRVRTIKSRALTDPTPQFVSLVGAAATMTPFAVTKSEQEKGAEGMSVRTRTRKLSATALDNKLIHPLQTSAVKQDGFAVAQVEFKRGERFPDRSAAMDWLDNGGYTEYTLIEVKSEDGERIVGWRVENTDVVFDGETKAIDAGRGVTVSVGKVKTEEPAAKADEETEAKTAEEESVEKTAEPEIGAATDPKSEEPAAKGGDIDAVEDKTVQPGANSEQPEGTPEAPAAKEEAPVSEAGTESKPEETAAKSDAPVIAKKSVYTLDSLTDVVSALQWIASDAAYDELFAGMDSTVSDGIKKLSAELLLVIAQVAQQEAAAIATKTEASAVKEAEQAPAIKIEEIVAAAVKPVADTMAEAMKSFTTAIGALSTKVDEANASVEKRVEALESRAQTRKGADVETSNAPASEARKEAENSRFVRGLSLRSAMGIGSKR